MIKMTWFPDYINWCKGEVEGREFSAKLYDEPSEYGINNGRVSNLDIPGVAGYDRGWSFNYDNNLVTSVVDFLESTEKRFEGNNERISWSDCKRRLKEDGML